MARFEKGHKGYWLGKKRSEEDREKMRKKHRSHTRVTMSLRHKYSISRSLKGAKNPNWKGGISELNKLIRKSLKYREWRKSVFERDDYTCQVCYDNSGGNLEADHIKSFARFPELRFDLKNGRTLCEECHRKTDTYGSKSRKLLTT